jgi:hypothetical protein
MFGLLICLLASPYLKAQTEEDKTVTLTVTSTGSTSDEAKEKALRNAIEQAFGVFISSRTEILNDELISDQITSIASGNIKSYEVLNETQIPTGGFATTLKATVSVNKLTSFVEAKGVSVEIKGGLFALNVKQQILNEKNEFKIIYEMVGMIHEILQQSFDYELSTGEIKSSDGSNEKWEVPLKISVKANQNMDFCSNYVNTILDAISLKIADAENYKSLNKNLYKINLYFNGQEKAFYLRQESSVNALTVLVDKWEFYSRLFVVHSGIDTLLNIGKGSIEPLGTFETTSSNKTLGINFPKSGQLITLYNYIDVKTLKQLEQITKYTVKPRGLVLPIKNGGFVVYEMYGHGLVKMICEMGKYTWESAKTTSDELELYGISNWVLPSKSELEKIINSYQKNFWTENQFEWLLWSQGYAGNPIEGNCDEKCFGILQPVYRY